MDMKHKSFALALVLDLASCGFDSKSEIYYNNCIIWSDKLAEVTIPCIPCFTAYRYN